ncbi:MAG: hypothetical protein A2007_01100 [Verrucomicrobia bacterium GWC2_42_7]|nr:MAG: hypothetical protein A2007_01100 [Verrucomicrobia bacterium GWC2_42_7]
MAIGSFEWNRKSVSTVNAFHYTLKEKEFAISQRKIQDRRRVRLSKKTQLSQKDAEESLACM